MKLKSQPEKIPLSRDKQKKKIKKIQFPFIDYPDNDYLLDQVLNLGDKMNEIIKFLNNL